MQIDIFETLATKLPEVANKKNFKRTLIDLGPFCFELFVDPCCEHLTFDAPFFNTCELTESLADRLRIFVIVGVEGSLPFVDPFFLYAAKHIDARQQHSAPQVVTYDADRGLLKVFDIRNQIAMFFITNLEKLPSWEQFSPVKEFIHLYALSQSCLLLHAACLVMNAESNDSVLVVGPGGSGKSSLTAYAASKNMMTNGDDYVLVDLRTPVVTCWTVYRTLKMHPSSPASLEGTGFTLWQHEPLAGKLVYLGQSVEQNGNFVTSSHIQRIFGVMLQSEHLSTGSNLHKRVTSNTLLAPSPFQNPYLYSCVSTIVQIPYWIDTTLLLTKRLHQAVAFEAHTIGRGTQGMSRALLQMAKGF